MNRVATPMQDYVRSNIKRTASGTSVTLADCDMEELLFAMIEQLVVTTQAVNQIIEDRHNKELIDI